MISASHNPFGDNGIKLVNRRGEKIGDEIITVIEDYLDSNEILPRARGDEIGRIVDHAAGRNRYLGYLISLAANSYKHLRIGLDCANGSAWMMGRAVFEALGARTYVIGNTPNGTNINEECGSTHIERLRRLVAEQGLDMGFAFDGDGDRCIAVDERGNEVNGDHILYILGCALKSRGALSGDTVVSTVMSNMGLIRALEGVGIASVQTTVGDRYVYECMTRDGYDLGGEQSGHIILRKYATTGDGLLTAIMLAEQVVETKRTLSELASPVMLYPQITVNLPVTDKSAVLHHPAVEAKRAECNRRLGKDGRLLLRASGTEPLLRIMVEAAEEEICRAMADEMAETVRKTGLTL